MDLTLEEVLNIIKGNGEIIFTRKSINEIRSLGLTIIDAENQIRNLRINEYQNGPEYSLDPSHSGSVWIFNKNISRQQLYIKISIDRCKIICISFHENSKW